MTLQPANFKPTVFKTSRQMDFFSESELVTQTGHPIEKWPLVFLKETIDNALDACEESDTVPRVTIVASAQGLRVKDNGPGIPESTIEGVLDFDVRASSREAYVSPTRGAQGNALMTLVGMPYVLARDDGALVITSCGKRRTLRVQPNALTQTPEVVAELEANRSKGTTIELQWPKWPFEESPTETETDWEDRTVQDHVFELLRGYVLFNPHLTLSVDWFGRKETYQATSDNAAKWKPSQPSSAHWYTCEQFARLVGAYIAHDRGAGTDRTVYDFLTAFDSLKGTAKRKKILDATNLARVNLSDFALDDGLDASRLAMLLSAMKEETRPVKPLRLGAFGGDHARKRFRDWGCLPESVTYVKQADFDDAGLPVVIEVCFGVIEESLANLEYECRRTMLVGANFSAAIGNPFREFGSSGEGLEAALNEARAGMRKPVIYAAHLTRPLVVYTDRGKSAIALS